jgi:hypothetical protein
MFSIINVSRESGQVGKSERKKQGSRIQGVRGPSERTKGIHKMYDL